MKAELLWTEHLSPTSIRMRWRASVDALEFEPGQFIASPLTIEMARLSGATPLRNTRTTARLAILTF